MAYDGTRSSFPPPPPPGSPFQLFTPAMQAAFNLTVWILIKQFFYCFYNDYYLLLKQNISSRYEYQYA